MSGALIRKRSIRLSICSHYRENTVNKYLKDKSMVMDLIKHTRDHLVRIYPKGDEGELHQLRTA